MINILNKEKAELLMSMGFKCKEYNSSNDKKIYSFFDIPEIRKVVSCQFEEKDFYITNTVFM